MTDARKALAEARDIIVAYFDHHGINDARAGAFNILARLEDAGLTVTRSPLPGTREEAARASAGTQDPEPIAWRWKISPHQKNWIYSESPSPVPRYNVEPLYAALPPAPMPEREGMRAMKRAEVRDRVAHFHRNACYPDAMRHEIDECVDGIIAALAPHDKADARKFKITSYPSELMGEVPHDKTEDKD